MPARKAADVLAVKVCVEACSEADRAYGAAGAVSVMASVGTLMASPATDGVSPPPSAGECASGGKGWGDTAEGNSGVAGKGSAGIPGAGSSGGAGVGTSVGTGGGTAGGGGKGAAGTAAGGSSCGGVAGGNSGITIGASVGGVGRASSSLHCSIICTSSVRGAMKDRRLLCLKKLTTMVNKLHTTSLSNRRMLKNGSFFRMHTTMDSTDVTIDGPMSNCPVLLHMKCSR